MLYNHGQIRCFLKVAECSSFSKAARELFMTVTAISKQIRNLELSLDEQLFLRTTRQVKLTEFGLVFYERCKIIENQISTLGQFVESKKEQPEGELSLLVSTITSKEKVMNCLPEFVSLYPKIRLSVTFSELDSELGRDDLDVMIGFPEIAPFTESLKYRPLFKTANILCASPEFLANYGIPKSPDDLPNFRFISHTLRKPAHFLPLNDGSKLYCGEPVLYMDNFDMLNQACLQGIGLFLTGDMLVKRWLASGELVQVLPELAFKSYDISIFYRPYLYELSKIRACVTFFQKKLTE
jgi:DNA-binding transcriptional LysR family regulator